MTLAVRYGRGESCKEPAGVMDAQIEHQNFTVLALYLVPRFVVCEARTIAEGWSVHGSPPTLEGSELGSLQKPSEGDGSSLHISPNGIGLALTLIKQGVESGEKSVIGVPKNYRIGRGIPLDLHCLSWRCGRLPANVIEMEPFGSLQSCYSLPSSPPYC